MADDTKYESRNPKYEPDQPRERPVLERKRQWEHGAEGREGCQRRDKPIFTNPDRLPDPCGRDNPYAYGCSGKEWISKGLVWRDKKTKQVVGKVMEQ